MKLTPSQIVHFLDRHVIGQEDAKKQLAVAVYTHYKKVAQAQNASLVKSNVLLIGPTGTGKTLLCDTLAQALEVPFVTANATSLAQSEFVNAEIEAILQRLIDKAAGDIGRAGRGIVFIDEVDKLRKRESDSGAGGERVQHALLKIMEGAPVKLADGRYLDTTQILFICGGAFVGLDEILADSQTYGFIATDTDSRHPDHDRQKTLDRLNARVKPTDLFQYGLIPEFTGRLPIVARLQPLSRALLVRIQTEPQQALYKQFQAILAEEGVVLDVAPAVFEQIADLAIEYRAGARSLRGIFEELLMPALYLVPDHPEVKKVVIASLFDPPRYLGAAKAES